MYTERQTQIINHFRAVYAEFGRNAEQYPILVWTDNGDGGLGFIYPQEVEELIEQGCKFFAAIPPKVRNMWTSTDYRINRSILDFTPPAPAPAPVLNVSPADQQMLDELFQIDGDEPLTFGDKLTALDDLIMMFESDKRVMSGNPRFTAQERRDTRQCLKAFIGLKARLTNPAD